jgi:hypothetical protein
MNSVAKILFVALAFSACKNQPATPAAADGAAILKHKYWVSKPFNDALFASDVMDTLHTLDCGEIVFTNKDSLLLTYCLSDAGRGGFKANSPTELEVVFEGFESKVFKLNLDEKTGILHLKMPDDMDGWPSEFVAQDGIDVSSIDNVTINLGRKRLAGNYTMLAPAGGAAITSLLELRTDGTQVGLGDFDFYEPWPSGIGGGFIQNPSLNLMYLVKKGQASQPTAAAWQVRGDTLRIWDTKNINPDGDLPEYRISQLRGTYLKSK